ncbi:MAG: DNA cytosine methyltransferase, partial [Oscillospiraceae bacterium]|nr:DNA cytosine methyltransferase [Oscillospiraceae bacterium]
GTDSAGFGVPQSRKRVYLAGCLGVDCSGKILAFGNSDEENSRKVKQLIGGSQGQRVQKA